MSFYKYIISTLILILEEKNPLALNSSYYVFPTTKYTFSPFDMTLKCVESINLSLRENANKNKVQIIILPTSQFQIILGSIVCEWLIIQFTLFIGDLFPK